GRCQDAARGSPATPHGAHQLSACELVRSTFGKAVHACTRTSAPCRPWAFSSSFSSWARRGVWGRTVSPQASGRPRALWALPCTSSTERRGSANTGRRGRAAHGGRQHGPVFLWVELVRGKVVQLGPDPRCCTARGSCEHQPWWVHAGSEAGAAKHRRRARRRNACYR